MIIGDARPGRSRLDRPDAVGGGVAVNGEVHRVGRLVRPHQTDLVAAEGDDRGDVVARDGRLAERSIVERKGRTPGRVVTAGGANRRVHPHLARGAWSVHVAHSCPVESFAMTRVSILRLWICAGKPRRANSVGCRVVAVAIEIGRGVPVPVLPSFCTCEATYSFAPSQSTSAVVLFRVTNDAGVRPRLRSRVELEEMEVTAHRVEHVTPPEAVVEPELRLGLRAARRHRSARPNKGRSLGAGDRTRKRR